MSMGLEAKGAPKREGEKKMKNRKEKKAKKKRKNKSFQIPGWEPPPDISP